MKLFTTESRNNGRNISTISMNKQKRLRQRKLHRLNLDLYRVTGLWFLIVMFLWLFFEWVKHCHYERWYKTWFDRLIISLLFTLLSIVLLDIVNTFHCTVTQTIFFGVYSFFMTFAFKYVSWLLLMQNLRARFKSHFNYSLFPQYFSNVSPIF